MARPGRLELPTLCLEGRRSIQLSYGRVDYRNSITELETSDQPILQVPFHCAQLCATQPGNCIQDHVVGRMHVPG